MLWNAVRFHFLKEGKISTWQMEYHPSSTLDFNQDAGISAYPPANCNNG